MSSPKYILVVADISGALHDARDKVIVFAIIWMPYNPSKWQQFNQQFADIKARYGYNREIKFHNLQRRAKLLALYKQIIDLFFDTDDLYFSCLVVQKDGSKAESKIFKQPELVDQANSYYTFMHVSRAANRKYCNHEDCLTFLHDVGELEKTIAETEAAIRNYFPSPKDKFHKNVFINYSCEVDSRSFCLMQLCDLLAGAVHKRVRSGDVLSPGATKDFIEHIEARLQQYQPSQRPDIDYYLHKRTKNPANIKLQRWFWPAPARAFKRR